MVYLLAQIPSQVRARVHDVTATQASQVGKGTPGYLIPHSHQGLLAFLVVARCALCLKLIFIYVFIKLRNKQKT